MALIRTAPRRDASEAEIVGALRAYGCTVVQLSGRGVPDLLVGARNRVWFVLEVKTGKAQLNPDQRSWHAYCRGPKPYVVRNASEAIAAMHDSLAFDAGADS